MNVVINIYINIYKRICQLSVKTNEAGSVIITDNSPSTEFPKLFKVLRL